MELRIVAIRFLLFEGAIGQSQGAAVGHQAVHAIIARSQLQSCLATRNITPTHPYDRGRPRWWGWCWPTGLGNDVGPEQYDGVASY